MDKESLGAKRDAITRDLEEKLGKLKELTNIIEQVKAAILVDRGRVDVLEGLIKELGDGTSNSEPSE